MVHMNLSATFLIYQFEKQHLFYLITILYFKYQCHLSLCNQWNIYTVHRRAKYMQLFFFYIRTLICTDIPLTKFRCEGSQKQALNKSRCWDVFLIVQKMYKQFRCLWLYIEVKYKIIITIDGKFYIFTKVLRTGINTKNMFL